MQLRREMELGDVANVFIAGVFCGWIAYVSLFAFFTAVSIFGALLILIAWGGK